MAQHPPLVGRAFTGEITIDVLQYLPCLTDNGPETKTNRAITFQLRYPDRGGGVIGYGLFAGLFVGQPIARNRWYRHCANYLAET
jgi:hypothetical protein